MRILVTGSSGLIGTALLRSLRDDGHEVRRLVRHAPKAADQSQWDPTHHQIDDSALAGIEAVVHLAGVGVADKRWTDKHKRAILDSRVAGTTTIAAAVARRAEQVKVLVSASAVGWYGDRGDAVLDEADPAGEGFLADVVRQWEAATAVASESGVRTVKLRSGIVLSPDGGILGKTLPLFKLGLGGRLGGGEQWMPWIALADEISAVKFVLTHPELAGPVNLSAPEPVRNTEYTATLGQVLHRPTVAAVPSAALRLALAGFADEGALVSQRAVPRKLLDAGFAFTYPDLDGALRAML